MFVYLYMELYVLQSFFNTWQYDSLRLFSYYFTHLPPSSVFTFFPKEPSVSPILPSDHLHLAILFYPPPTFFCIYLFPLPKDLPFPISPISSLAPLNSSLFCFLTPSGNDPALLC